MEYQRASTSNVTRDVDCMSSALLLELQGRMTAEKASSDRTEIATDRGKMKEEREERSTKKTGDSLTMIHLGPRRIQPVVVAGSRAGGERLTRGRLRG
jgi:hypothetical protein